MYLCVKCGKELKFKEIKGSARAPYCADCFKKVWNGDNEAYMKWLGKKESF